MSVYGSGVVFSLCQYPNWESVMLVMFDPGLQFLHETKPNKCQRFDIITVFIFIATRHQLELILKKAFKR